MTIALAAVGAALATLVVTLLFQWLVHRSPEPDERLTKVVHDLEARMDDMVRELTGALEASQLEGQRTRLLGELAGSIDLDEVLTRVLDAAGSIDGVDAALISLASQPGGQPIVASLGLSAEEAERQSVSGPPDGREARAITMSYDYSAEQVAADADAIRAGVAVPLPGEAAPLGFVTIFTRAPALTFSAEQVGELEELAMRAGPAIENASRFREARQLADLDALTGLHNRRYFHETLAREVARAHRYSRGLALVLVDIDDFKGVNDRIGHLAGDGALAETAGRVREAVRESDIPCRIGGDELGLILPESRLADAQRLGERIEQAVVARPAARAGHIRVSAGFAELQPNDDSTSLFERADQSLYAEKQMRKSGGGLAAAE